MSFVKRCVRNFWCFLGVFLTCSVLQNMISTFLTSGIQSIERQFQIPSKKSGTLLSANRLGYIPTVLFLAHFGNKGNRARWIGAGSMIVAVGCLLAALPNFIFPPKPVFTTVDPKFVLNAITSNSTSNWTSMDDFLNNPVVGPRIPSELRTKMAEWDDENELNSSLLDMYFPVKSENTSFDKKRWKNVNESADFKIQLVNKLSTVIPSLYLIKKAELPFGYCNSTIMKLKNAVKEKTCEKRKLHVSSNEAAYSLVFAAITLFGIGQSMPWTLGTPLIDDNVKRQSAPFYFAAIRSIRIMGPVFGLWLGAGCFKLYVTLHDPPGLSPTDPRWIGAWWLGFLIIGVLLFLPSLLLFFYPDVKFGRKKSSKLDKHKEVVENGVKDENQHFTEKPLLHQDRKDRKDSITSYVEEQGKTCAHEIKSNTLN